MATTPRPASERWLIGLVLFQGITGTIGGLVLLINGSGMPESWLAEIPFTSWFWPGIILGVGLGLAPLGIGYGLLRRASPGVLADAEVAVGYRWPWVGSVCLGIGLVAWIVVELLLIPEVHWLMQPLYLGVGAGIVGTAVRPRVRERWRVPAGRGTDADEASEDRILVG